ncbi:MAG: hypothetical protein CO043_03235 [Parcubacteria group bacterium CG_4_9_14_0_2_um_filter_48_40]|nr:MAG: hypothetical protein COY83_03100 [Parcubacteria group bacterium CG_4_10_14_0_8_um_filter_48_154]PJC39629.1 MAG: hypothetical protein CO043_03235 [Parcubacteria group bacterium CG_4_9_14_0_2_um_filter_48_40]
MPAYFRTIILSCSLILIGLLAGLIGGLVVVSIFLTRVQPEPMIIQKEREIVPVFGSTEEDNFLRARVQLEGGIAGFYRKRTTEGERPLLTDFLENGVALTTDGWIMTLDNNLLDDTQTWIVWLQGTAYTPEAVVHDPATTALFVKINASNIPIARFSDADDAKLLGERVFAITHDGQVMRTAVQQIGGVYDGSPGVYLRTTETLSRRMLLQDAWQEAFLGSPVYSTDGSIIGVMEHTSADPTTVRILPLSLVRDVLNQVFKNQNIVRTLLGVQYRQEINRAHPDASRTIITASPKRAAVVKGSPAADAGLREGDVLLMINNAFVDGGKDFAEMVQEYKPETVFVLTYERNGQEQKERITLQPIP